MQVTSTARSTAVASAWICKDMLAGPFGYLGRLKQPVASNEDAFALFAGLAREQLAKRGVA